MGNIKQHCMIKMARGECHPIFSCGYLAENIASLIETIVLFVEACLITVFLLNTFINLFSRYAMDNAAGTLINAVSSELLSGFGIRSSTWSNLLALLIMLSVYVITYTYFEFVKYNLHPKHLKTKRTVVNEEAKVNNVLDASIKKAT